MKKWVALLFVCIYANSFSQTNISPQFSELKGMEDQLGNTHLFYRIYKDSTWGEYYFYHSNHIYKINVTTETDSFFLPDYAYENETGQYFFRVNDYDFWDDNEYKYIYCGGGGDFYSYTYVKRFDDNNFLFGDWQGSVSKINISRQDDSIIYIGSWATDIAGQNPIRTSKSTHGGYTWDTISDTLQFLAVKPDNDQVLFSFNDNGYISNYNGGLYKSTNGGVNFYLVDTLKKYPNAVNDEIMFDANANNIFRLFETMYGDFVLRISLNNGEAFSWETKYSSDSEIFISNDESISGTIYLADKKNIFRSTNYGNNFSLYKTLERKIVGIYKKPSSGKLYAATKYKIYEITPDTIQVIKSLPIPQEVLNYYPLATGNKWVNLHTVVINPNVYYSVSKTEVIGDSIAPNGKMYYHLVTANEHYLDRIDSLEGKIYRYYDEYPNLIDSEYVVADLLAEVGDSIPSFNPSIAGVYSYTKLIQIDTFNNWGLNKSRKVYHQVAPGFTVYRFFSFTNDIGPDYSMSGGWYGTNTTTLKGCVINGIVYGDTTLTDVEDEETPIATSFKLEQNYPNPFNPSTVISYRLPITSNVTLKVYDVLGNEIATLVNEEKPAGEYEVEFNAVSHSGEVQNLTSGIYFYQLNAGSFIQTKKMVYLK